MEIRDPHSLAPGSAEIRACALDGRRGTQSLDEALEHGGNVQREQEAGQMVAQAFQHQGPINLLFRLRSQYPCGYTEGHEHLSAFRGI